MRYTLSTLTRALVVLIVSQNIQGIDLINHDEPSSNINAVFDDGSDYYSSPLTRAQEQEIHSPSIVDHKYVSDGANEEQQYLTPNGQIPNRPEVKTDEELPSYCNPPNPCPLGFEADDCDASSMSKFTAEYSRLYQAEQDCQCDKNHDKCPLDRVIYTVPSFSTSDDILKRSRRVRRDSYHKQRVENATKIHLHRNPFHKGQRLRFHVAKKSPFSMTT